MANSENQVELKLNLDVSGVQSALYDMIGDFTGTGKEFDKITKKIEESFKNLEAVIKRFGIDSKEAAAASATYQKSLTALVANGIDPASVSFQRLESSVLGAGGAIDKSSNSLKKNNMMWTNLALVVQDLPFGFRGIQNNLPALMGGFAAMTGPLYLAGSALIALFTIWDNNSSKTIDGINKVTEAQKRQTDIIKKAAEAESEAFIEMRKMSTIFEGVKTGSIDAEDALKKYNETYGNTFGIAKNVNEAEDIFIRKSGAYVKAMAIRAMADEKYAQAQEEFKKGRLASGKDNTTFLTKFASALDALDKVGIMGFDPASLFSYVTKLTKNFVEVNTEATRDVINSAATSFDLLMAQGAAFDKEANSILSKAGIKPVKTKPDKKVGKTDAEKEAERMAKAEEYLANWQIKLNTDIANAQVKEGDRVRKKQEDDRNQEIKDYTERVNLFKTFYANKLQLAEGDRQQQKSILEQQMQDLVYFSETFGMYAGDVGDIFSDVYKKWVDNNKAITDEATKSIINMGVGIMNALGPALDMLLEKGASIGEVLSTAFTDIIKKLIKVAIAAAVAVAVISLLPGMQGKIAEAGGKLAYFGKLVGTGMGIPNLFSSSAGTTATNTAQGVSNGLNASSGINVNVVGKIAGGDILLASQQAQRNNESTF